MFANGFPAERKDDVLIVSDLIPQRTYHNVKTGMSENYCDYVLIDGQVVSFPYRIYYIENGDTTLSSLTFSQKMIYHAIFSRSCDGFVREKHLKAILSEDFPHWMIPYIFKLSDEYVVEILESIYQGLKEKNTDELKLFCRINIQSFLYSHNRMISYWNEFYRHRCYSYRDYIGRKLYSEQFGYTRSMEKQGGKRGLRE